MSEMQMKSLKLRLLEAYYEARHEWAVNPSQLNWARYQDTIRNCRKLGVERSDGTRI